MAEEPVAGPPIALAPPTFARFDEATRYVEGVVRTRAPRPSLERFPGLAPGAWGRLPSGKSIAGRSGLTLGEGDVTLLTQDGAKLTDSGESVHVYNAGPAVNASGLDLVVPLAWVLGNWTVAGSGSSSRAATGRCDCPDADYNVDITCGDCGSAYGESMPKTWYARVTRSDAWPYGYGYGYGHCDDFICPDMVGASIPLDNETVQDCYYGEQPTCVWSGKGPRCLHGELAVEGVNWKLTITDKSGCVLAVLRKPVVEFDCCGPNRGWTADPLGACDVDVTLEPDPCTCCPEKRPCPPVDEPMCKDTPCCIDSCACGMTVTVAGLATPTGLACTAFDTDCTHSDGTPCHFGDPDCLKNRPTAEKSCGGMNGAYAMQWSRGCTWEFHGTPATSGLGIKVKAKLTLAGRTWTLELKGKDGQTATFRLENWNCNALVVMPFVGGTCPQVGGAPFATVQVCNEGYY